MPTIGSAATSVAHRQQPAPQERHPVHRHRRQERRAAADRIARQRPLHEGLHHVGPERRRRWTRSAPRSRSAPAAAPGSPRARARPAPRPASKVTPKTSGGSQRQPARAARQPDVEPPPREPAPPPPPPAQGSPRASCRESGPGRGRRSRGRWRPFTPDPARLRRPSAGRRRPMRADRFIARLPGEPFCRFDVSSASKRRQAAPARRSRPSTTPTRSPRAGSHAGRAPSRAHAAARRAPITATSPRREDRGHEQRRPDLHRLAVVAARQHPRAQARRPRRSAARR